MTDRTPARNGSELDASDAETVSRRTYLQATGAAALGATGLAGCVGKATGTLATRVTDQPADIGDFESLVVTIQGIWLGPEGAESGADGNETDAGGDGDDGETTDGNETDGENDGDEPAGREYLEFDEPQEADLVQLQDGETQLIDERELSVGTYRFLQLDVSNVEGILDGGDEAEIDLPGNAPLTFNAEFEVREDTRTSFTADFAPVRRGTGTYLLRPVPRGIEVSYEESDEGGDANETDGES